MAKFVDLPPEIISMIITNVHPDDIECFTSVSKRIHSLSEDARSKHRPLKVEFQTYKTNFFIHERRCLSTLILRILAHPEVVYHVKHLEVAQRDYDFRLSWEGMSQLAAAILRVIDPYDAEYWRRNIEVGYNSPPIA